MCAQRVLPALGISLALIAANAQAADLPTQRPAVAPVTYESAPPFTWTGPYLALQGGYSWDSEDVYLPWTWQNPWSVTRHGGFGGAVGGYDYQFGRGLIGLQADYNIANISGGAAPHGLYNTTNKVNNFGAVDGRLGLAFDRLLIYAVAGLGMMDVTHTVSNPLRPFANGSYNSFQTGFNIGIGVEYAFTNNLSGFADFRNFRMPSKWYGPIPALGPHSVTETLDTVRFGVKYKFGA
jgi:outer membrane immunogenic protein